MRKPVWETIVFKNEADVQRAYELLRENGFDVECESLLYTFCRNELLDHLERTDLLDHLKTLPLAEFDEAIDDLTMKVYEQDFSLEPLVDVIYDVITLAEGELEA